MATGYTQVELDVLSAIMDRMVPPVPTHKEKRAAPRVTAMRAAGTHKGAVFNIQVRGRGSEIFWFNCWTAKEMAGAISFTSQTYGWANRGLIAKPCDHLKAPKITDIETATEVLSLSTLGESSGILVRLAVGSPVTYRLLYFPARSGLEFALAVARGGNTAGWWDADFELIPSRESQH
jgi:hypothetical protein